MLGGAVDNFLDDAGAAISREKDRFRFRGSSDRRPLRHFSPSQLATEATVLSSDSSPECGL